MDNVVYLTVLRKIKGLEETIKNKRNLLKVKEDYLNQLSKFQYYDTIRIECHKLYDDNTRLLFNIGMHEQALENLRKEL